jgi:S-formylglutathione hydrolase
MTTIHDTFFSRILNRNKHVTILTPNGCGDAIQKYPVLYLLHGYGGNRQSWLNNTRIDQLITRFPMIVVFPESGRRWFINDSNGYHYEDYLVKELIHFVDLKFAMTSDRRARGIGGFSMGGAAAVFTAFRHPSLFSTAFAHSGAFEGPLRTGDPYAAFRTDPDLLMPTVEMHEKVWGPPGSAVRKAYDPYHLVNSWDQRYDLNIYFDQGLDDFERMIQMNRNFHHALQKKKIPHRYEERPGKHDWNFINDSLAFSIQCAYSHFNSRNHG